MSALFLPVEDERQDVEAELGDIQTKLFELLFGFVTQNVASLRPERSHRFPDRLVVGRGVRVDIASIGKLTLRAAVDAVDFGVGEVFQRRDSQFLGEGVDASVFQKLLATVVDLPDDLLLLTGDRAGGIIAGILVLQEVTEGFDVLVWEFNAPLVSLVARALHCTGQIFRLGMRIAPAPIVRISPPRPRGRAIP